jgi:hypothetical protein
MLFAACPHAGFLLSLFLDPEDGDMSSETSVNFQLNSKCCIPRDGSLHALFYYYESVPGRFAEITHCGLDAGIPYPT